MPQLPFADEHKASTSNLDFPRLKLEQNERKRILLLDDPNFAYVHELRAPKIVDGKAQLVTIDRGGSKITDYEKDFIGRPLCLGDIDILSAQGVDPANCPVCARSIESDEVDKPKRRFAVPVIVYATKPGSFDLRTPFSCELVVWSFTDKAYNKLVDLVKEWGENGKIRNHDLNLGPCTNQGFQQYEINVASTAAWLASEERKAHVLETYRDNKPADLDQFCGRKVSKTWLAEDLAKVRDRWAIANGRQARNERAEALNDGLDALAGQSSEQTVGQVDIAGLLDDTTPVAQSGTQAKNGSAPAEDAADAKPIDFQDLLNNLG